jgi:hypothetical protein
MCWIVSPILGKTTGCNRQYRSSASPGWGYCPGDASGQPYTALETPYTMSELTAAATYLLASIANEGDRELAAETYRAISDAMPHHLRGALDDAWEMV